MSVKGRSLRFLLLRLFLGYSALGWGICVAAIVVPAETAFALLTEISGVDTAAMAAEPMFDYWLRMAAGAFALVGAGYLGLAVWPRKFHQVLPFAGGFMVAEGLILAAHGLRLGLGPAPFYGDVAFCLAGGIGILMYDGQCEAMPLALNIPDEGGERLRLQSGFHGPIRGSAGRRKAWREIEERDRNVGAVMHVSLICTCLWSLFWLQFVIGVPFNMPVIHTLVGEGWFRPDVTFYIPCDGPLPFSIAGNFVLISLIASGLALLADGCGRVA